MTERLAELDDLPHYASWLGVVKNYVKCQRLLTLRLAKLNLTPAQHEVLMAVARNEGCSQNALARWLLVAKSNVTGLLSRMGKDGLIRREADPQDARGRCVFLTELGRQKLTLAVRVQAEVVRLMTSDISDEESQALRRVMGRVGENLDRALADDRA